MPTIRLPAPLSLIEELKASDILGQGVFVAISGLVIVFVVLALFFFTIKLLQKAGSRKNKPSDQ